jgi:hypothetical protein
MKTVGIEDRQTDRRNTVEGSEAGRDGVSLWSLITAGRRVTARQKTRRSRKNKYSKEEHRRPWLQTPQLPKK